MMFGELSPLEQMIFLILKSLLIIIFFDPVKIVRSIRDGSPLYQDFFSQIPFLLEKECLQSQGLFQEQRKTSRKYSEIRGKARGFDQVDILDQFMRVRKKAKIIPIDDELRLENLHGEYYLSNGSLKPLELSQTDLELCALSIDYQIPILTEDLGISRYMNLLPNQGFQVISPIVYYRNSAHFTQ